MKLSLVIEGPIVPWGRPRRRKATNNEHMERVLKEYRTDVWKMMKKSKKYHNPVRYERYRQHVHNTVKSLMLKDRMMWNLEGPFGVTMVFYFQDESTRDLDRCASGVLDALKGVLWGDDKWQYFRDPGWITMRCDIDESHPRVELEVETVGCRS